VSAGFIEVAPLVNGGTDDVLCRFAKPVSVYMDLGPVASPTDVLVVNLQRRVEVFQKRIVTGDGVRLVQLIRNRGDLIVLAKPPIGRQVDVPV
jgi:hypothetical protein